MIRQERFHPDSLLGAAGAAVLAAAQSRERAGVSCCRAGRGLGSAAVEVQEIKVQIPNPGYILE